MGYYPVCPRRENSKVLIERFTKKSYAPPLFLGLRCQLFTITPAMHAINQATGEEHHIRDRRFSLQFNMN